VKRVCIICCLMALALGPSTAPGCAQESQEPQPRYVAPGAPGQPPSDAVVLFEGKDLSQWMTRDGGPAKCNVSDGVMTCKSGDGNLYTRSKFRSAQIHLEFDEPLMPEQHGQLRGNSGVFLQGRYEIQILDSYQNPTYPTGVCGALYGQSPPLVNASRPSGHWETYDIIFHAPKCDADGKYIERATLTLLQNGILVQDHVVIGDKATQRNKGVCVEEGPLVLQDHSGFRNAPMTSMRFRNIWYRPLGDE
jgi:hypothetical protein